MLNKALTRVKLGGLAERDMLTPELEENGMEVSFDSNDNLSMPPSPIAPLRASTSVMDRETSTDESDEEGINFGIRRPGQRLMDTTEMSFLPSQKILEDVLELQPWQRHASSVQAYIDDYNIIERVRSTEAPCHFTEGKPTYLVHAPQSQRVFADVKSVSADIGMIVNDAKTQMLCISQSGGSTKSYINTESNRLISGKSLKILGFTFGSTPDVTLHTGKLVKKFNYDLWGLWHLKKAGMKSPDLLMIYKAALRPTIEFASNTYHSLLTKEQSDDIERLQLRAMKTVCGTKVSYRTVLQSGLVESIRDRREKNFQKFAEKTRANPRFEHWFPPNPPVGHDLRRREAIFIPRLNTERGVKSPLIQIRKHLNRIT